MDANGFHAFYLGVSFLYETILAHADGVADARSKAIQTRRVVLVQEAVSTRG